MDPLVNILPELHEMILQHFSFEDFQETTEVSPYWNEILGESSKIMKKVKLQLNQPFSAICRLVEIAETVDECTTRRYQNAYIDPFTSSCKFSHNVLKYFLNTGQTLLDLEIEFLAVVSDDNTKIFNDLDLSKLKSLKLEFVSEELLTKILDRCNSLTHLYISGYSYKKISIPSLKSFLMRNESLKSLELCAQSHNAFFNEDISDVARFQLKRYYLIGGGEGHPDLITEAVEQNFMKFLAKQRRKLR